MKVNQENTINKQPNSEFEYHRKEARSFGRIDLLEIPIDKWYTSADELTTEQLNEKAQAFHDALQAREYDEELMKAIGKTAEMLQYLSFILRNINAAEWKYHEMMHIRLKEILASMVNFNANPDMISDDAIPLPSMQGSLPVLKIKDGSKLIHKNKKHNLKNVNKKLKKGKKSI